MTVIDQTNGLILVALRQRAADRRAHADYLESLIEDASGCADPRHLTRVLDDVRVPRGVTTAYAFALADDVQWLFTPSPTDEYPDAYRRLRDAAAEIAERHRDRRRAQRQAIDLLPL
jgi:hypothetical protein